MTYNVNNEYKHILIFYIRGDAVSYRLPKKDAHSAPLFVRPIVLI